jgi:uncharacterized protein (DUF1778 family)
MSQAVEAVSISTRAKARQRDLIDQAAARLGCSRSDFMLEAACIKAEDVLLDQAFFSVNASTFAKFQKLLDRPLPGKTNWGLRPGPVIRSFGWRRGKQSLALIDARH